MAQLGDIKVPMNGRPRPHFEVVHPQLVLGLFEALLDGPTAKRHAQQRFPRGIRRKIRNKVFDFI